jgi:hypothetical protein
LKLISYMNKIFRICIHLIVLSTGRIFKNLQVLNKSEVIRIWKIDIRIFSVYGRGAWLGFHPWGGEISNLSFSFPLSSQNLCKMLDLTPCFNWNFFRDPGLMSILHKKSISFQHNFLVEIWRCINVEIWRLFNHKYNQFSTLFQRLNLTLYQRWNLTSIQSQIQPIFNVVSTL